jgi:hypothetical protein
MSNNNTPNTETTSLKYQLGNENPDGEVMGWAATSKIGFYGLTTPITRPSGAVQTIATTAVCTTTAVTAGASGAYAYATSTQADNIALVADQARILANGLRLALVNLGLIAGAA